MNLSSSASPTPLPSGARSGTESRALSLLGSGIAPEMVASAIGVSVSRISQLLSDPEFSKEVLELRYAALASRNIRDDKVDALEDVLLDKIRDLLPFIVRPLEAIRAYSLINAAKRRGASLGFAESRTPVVTLVMPSTIINQYSLKTEIITNINNQVIKAGNQELITVPSGQMNSLLSAKRKEFVLPKGEKENV